MYLKGIFLIGLMIVSVARLQVKATPVDSVGNAEEEKQNNNEVGLTGSNKGEEDAELEIQSGDDKVEDCEDAVETPSDGVRGKPGGGQGGKPSGGQGGKPGGGQGGKPGGGQGGKPGQG